MRKEHTRFPKSICVTPDLSLARRAVESAEQGKPLNGCPEIDGNNPQPDDCNKELGGGSDGNGGTDGNGGGSGDLASKTAKTKLN